MRKQFIAGILTIPLLLLLAGCSGAKSPDLGAAALKRVIFDRGHGSLWGIQFYIDVCPDEITIVRYFSKDMEGSDLIEKTNLPITSEDWKELEDVLGEMKFTLEPIESPSFWKRFRAKLKEQTMLDGGEFRKLILTWEMDKDAQEIEYKWPGGHEAEALEVLLEEMVNNAE